MAATEPLVIATKAVEPLATPPDFLDTFDPMKKPVEKDYAMIVGPEEPNLSPRIGGSADLRSTMASLIESCWGVWLSILISCIGVHDRLDSEDRCRRYAPSYVAASIILKSERPVDECSLINCSCNLHVAASYSFLSAYLITHFSEFQLATIGTFLIHESVYFLSGLPTLYFERSGLFRKYKIQKKVNTPEVQWRCILRLVLYHVCVNLPLMLISYPTFRFMGLRSSLPLPPWSVIVSQIIFYFIVEDFVFYWGHRILHTKWLYQHVHSVHHEHATPFGLTSEYAHPAEILFLGFATILGPALTGPHLFTLWLWVIVRVLETVEAHSGYHFPWSPSNFIPLYGGADFHDYHHRLLYTKSGNYSSTFTYVDWIFGTDKGYWKLKAVEEVEGKKY
ncbi:hypothetical protein ZIOFF_008345 [Zingiber officinale]|uniref:aldehyde oxygenase (deformylating) n=1 Tax=Zingiber officinale TaxID=94328 RepID=A0A8J5HW11_ZINOF|nr:hypothetical protein ZIOFF_008345 [Zingiber officinale]